MTAQDAIRRAYDLGQLRMEYTRAGKWEHAVEVSKFLSELLAEFDTPPVHWVSGQGDD